MSQRAKALVKGMAVLESAMNSQEFDELVFEEKFEYLDALDYIEDSLEYVVVKE